MDNFTKFISNMSKIEKCNDDVNESITAVQFFNQHIRHLLIDDLKFVQQTNKIDKLSSDVTDIKKQLNKMQTNNISNPNEVIISEINELKKQLAEFASKPAISNFTDLEETIGEYSYRYPGGEHPAKEIPDEVQKLIECIRPSLPNPDMVINSCLVSKYATGDNFIPAHRDDEPVINPESDIITFSIGTSRTMKFVDNSDESVKNQILNDNSLLVSSRFSQDFWRHSIEKCESNEVRYSFTLRHVDPHFINSTIVLNYKLEVWKRPWNLGGMDARQTSQNRPY